MPKLKLVNGQDEGICKYFIETIEKYKKGEEINLHNLRKVIRLLDTTYAKGEVTALSDEAYDQLNAIYAELTGDVLTVTDAAGIKHDYPNLKGSLTKVHYVSYREKKNDPDRVESYKVLEDWVKNCLKMLPKAITHTLAFYHKADGCSIVLSLDEDHKITKAITRGDVDEGKGQDKTSIFGGIDVDSLVDKTFEGKAIGLKCEAIVTFRNFEKYNEKYFNGSLVDPRAAAVSLLSSLTMTEAHKKYLTLIPLMYEVDGESCPIVEGEFGPLRTLDFKNCDDSIQDLDKVLENIINELCQIEPDYPRDGIVVRWIDKSAIDTLGRNEERSLNNFETAYKFRPKGYYTHITNIEQDIGYLGNASFTAVFDPILIDGRTVTHASLGSYEIAKNLRLGIGDMVCIKYNTIPRLYVDAKCIEENLVAKNKPIELITHCPYCGQKLEEDPILRCVNPNCDYKEMGRIYNFCTAMRLKFIGPNTIETLFHHGYLKNILDLFKLKDHKKEIKNIERFGDLKINKIIKAVENIETTEANLIGAIGIKGIRAKRAKLVLDIYNIDALLKMSDHVKGSTKAIKRIRTIGHKFAMTLLRGVAENKDLIIALRDLVKIKERR